jgi:hypothetical protein
MFEWYKSDGAMIEWKPFEFDGLVFDRGSFFATIVLGPFGVRQVPKASQEQKYYLRK